jgi:hypothetical protein
VEELQMAEVELPLGADQPDRAQSGSDRSSHGASARKVNGEKQHNVMGIVRKCDRTFMLSYLCYLDSVKQLEELKRGPDLDTLFYPDYGLCQVFKIPELKPIARIARKDGDYGDSIAIFLQKMRAHVAGLQDLDALYSMVLYGPGGTGKTTLVEALASSCDVPLVEVTPSDIVVRGVEALERRARAVFEALSLLTRAVILFDEFEPVLRKRKAESPGPDTVFSWLTPGMLPKLKTLHRNAKKRSVAYVLVTNLIGELDDAATRTGRFDEKIGIYPPDVLSRMGRFWSEADIFMKYNPPQDPPKDDDLKARLRKIIEISSGAGMEALIREGYFRRPEDRKKAPQKDTPLHYYIYGSPEPTRLAQDAHLEEVKGSGDDVEREYQQWAWVESWDKKFSEEEGFKLLENPPKDVPDVPDKLKRSS